MFKPNEINCFVLLTICLLINQTIKCQSPETSSTLDAITDGMKSMFGLEQVVKTFKKISEGMIPFPLFVPIVPKNKVFDLLRGKKQTKEHQDTIDTISDSNTNLNKMQIPFELQQQLLAKLNPVFQHQLNEQMFFNMRQPIPEMAPDLSFMMNSGLLVPQLPPQPPAISADIRPNNVNPDNEEYSDIDENNNYAERYGTGLQSDEYVHTDDRKTPTAQDVMHNWQIIDEELKKIGQQLGKLGKYLNRNHKN